MGRVLVEAMAAEKPRIGSSVGGIPTMINDGVDGYLVEPENIGDLAKKLENPYEGSGLEAHHGTGRETEDPAGV
jgi:glycosyltransferase involved in cell wall biosynthesis